MSNRWHLFSLALTFSSALGSACTSTDGGSDPDGKGAAAGSDNAAAGADASGETAGGADSRGAAGASTEGGSENTAGEPSGGGSAGTGSTPGGAALPLDTFLYVRSLDEDRDVLVARSFATGKERIVTDLTADDSDGWEIWGHTLSPDRKTIVLASLFGPTQDDIDTQLATRRLWSLATDGSGFKRLTPVFENDGAGRKGFNISVQAPMFTLDGKGVLYEFGNWWYEGTTLEGGSLPWLVSAAGGLPALFPTVTSCTVVNPSVNPATGDVLLVHSVCVNSQDEGLFLYPSAGGTEPFKLLARGYGPDQVDPSLTTASWLGDGSGFVFVGSIDIVRGDATERSPSLLLFDMETGDVTPIIVPEPDTYVRSGTVSADGSSLVYCLQHAAGLDLHGIDLTQDPPVDVPLTDDGASCAPAF